MGMDYRYSGSASYNRFDNELCEVAKVFGGIEKHPDIYYGLETAQHGDKFIFPKGTNEILVKWFNNIYYKKFTLEETIQIWKCVSEHPEIKKISLQIWKELETLVVCEQGWYIF